MGGYHPSPSPKFPETFGDLIKIPLHDSAILMKEYGLEAAISDKKVPEEARLDNLNKLMLHFGVGFLSPALPASAHLFLMCRSDTGFTQDRRGKGQSSPACGTADNYFDPPPCLVVFSVMSHRCMYYLFVLLAFFRPVTQNLAPPLWGKESEPVNCVRASHGG